MKVITYSIFQISEINTIPSLAAKAETIDSYVKNPLVSILYQVILEPNPSEKVAEMFNIAGFHIPKQLAFKSGPVILEKLGWGVDSIKPLGDLFLNKFMLLKVSIT